MERRGTPTRGAIDAGTIGRVVVSKLNRETRLSTAGERAGMNFRKMSSISSCGSLDHLSIPSLLCAPYYNDARSKRE